MIKKNILIGALICFTTIACEKEELITDNKDKGIVGEWIWLKSYGGFTGRDIQTPEQIGIERIIKFYENDTVEILENGKLAIKTDYFLSREESILFNEKFNFLTINYKFKIANTDSIILLPMRHIILKLSDTLAIDEDVFDGYGHMYKRKIN